MPSVRVPIPVIFVPRIQDAVLAVQKSIASDQIEASNTWRDVRYHR
jgi:hypothetical protein